jgi:predicted phage tail component-like protein
MATNFNVPNQDYVGFSYGQWHCIRDGHIYRVSDGSRYNQNLIPSLTDKTADIPGADGQYFFGSLHKNRTFTINFAFDELSESHLKSLSAVFNGKEIKDLIFDEQPYKAYGAKVTGTPTIKVVSFDDRSGNRIYKGEGSVQFTCYNPYAHTPNWVWKYNSGGTFSSMVADGRKSTSYDENVYTSKS